jgi:transposase
MPTRKSYPSDVTDDEWAFVAPYLALVREDAPQRVHDLRQVFNALRWVVRTGSQWRFLPNDLPPWAAVYQQARRWVAARVFEHMADDLRMVLRAGYDGYKRRKGSKVHAAVDTLGHLLALTVTAASADERTQVFALCAEVQEATGQSVRVAFADQGYTGDQPAADAATHGIELVVVKPAEAKRGFVLLPKRWVVERTFAWLGRFRRLARDYERLAQTLAGWHWVAAVVLLLQRLATLAESA